MFTTLILVFTMTDPGVHVALIFAFTLEWIRVFSLDRYAQRNVTGRSFKPRFLTAHMLREGEWVRCYVSLGPSARL